MRHPICKSWQRIARTHNWASLKTKRATNSRLGHNDDDETPKITKFEPLNNRRIWKTISRRLHPIQIQKFEFDKKVIWWLTRDVSTYIPVVSVNRVKTCIDDEKEPMFYLLRDTSFSLLTYTSPMRRLPETFYTFFIYLSLEVREEMAPCSWVVEVFLIHYTHTQKSLKIGWYCKTLYTVYSP